MEALTGFATRSQKPPHGGNYRDGQGGDFKTYSQSERKRASLQG